MARSVGEAAAEGLTAGFLLGRNTQQMYRDNERQDRLDQTAIEDRQMLRATQQEQLARQKNADKQAAFKEQRRMLGAAQQGVIDSGAAQTPEAKKLFADQVKSLDEAEATHLAGVTGFDLAGVQKQAQLDLKDVTAATDLSTLKPGQLTRAITVATGGRAPADFVRGPDGAPSLVEQGGADLVQGLQSGDMQRVLKGANIVYAPSLKTGVGQPSPHGGVIVGKELVGFTPAPGSDESDPKFIPTVRVYVKEEGGTGPADSPFGATGHYDAPMTEDRSSKAEAKVRTISLKDGLEFVGHNLHVAELLSDPAAMAKLQEDQQSGDFDPAAYQAALGSAGVKQAPTKVQQHVIPAGGTLATTTTGRDGRSTTTTLEGQKKPPSGSVGAVQQTVNAIKALVDSGDITEAEGQERIRALLNKATTGTKSQGLAGGSGGSGGKSGEPSDTPGLSKGEERTIKAQQARLKEDQDDLKERRDQADKALDRATKPIGAFASPDEKKAHDAKVAKAEAEHAKTIKSLDDATADLKASKRALDERLAGNPAPASLADGKRKGDTGGADAARKPAGAAPPATLLKEGVNTKFKNGQTWTLRGGKAVQVTN